MAVAYLDPQGQRIGKKVMESIICENPLAYDHAHFDDGRVEVRVTATSMIRGVESIPEEHWKRVLLSVFNIIKTDHEGNLLERSKRVLDTDASSSYRTLPEAMTAYKKFLAKYSLSHFDEVTGVFREVGNIHTPPDPNVPTVSETNVAAKEAFGSW